MRPTFLDWVSSPAHSITQNGVEISLRDYYGQARSAGFDAMAEQTLEISDDLMEDANSRRVRCDARRWFVSKLKPERYGDNQRIEHTAAGGAPLSLEIVFTPVPQRQSPELENTLQQLEAPRPERK